jgi:hypothetical protein
MRDSDAQPLAVIASYPSFHGCSPAFTFSRT